MKDLFWNVRGTRKKRKNLKNYRTDKTKIILILLASKKQKKKPSITNIWIVWLVVRTLSGSGYQLEGQLVASCWEATSTVLRFLAGI